MKVGCVCCGFDVECYVDFANWCVIHFVVDEQEFRVLHHTGA